MLSSISNSSDVSAIYAAQQAGSAPKVPALLQNTLNGVQTAAAEQIQDVYLRADGSEAVVKNNVVKNNDVKKNEVKRPVLDLVSESKQTDEEKPLSDEDKRLKEALHQFVGQTLFGQMLKAMRSTQQKNPFFDGGRAEEIFQGQLDTVLTDQMTKSASRSLSEPAYKLMTASKTK